MTSTLPCVLLVLVVLSLGILFSQSAEFFHNDLEGGWNPADMPAWKGRGPDALPWGGWDQLDHPNPLRRPPFPPADGGEQWHEPLLLAYGGGPLPNCGTDRRNTC